MTLISCVAMWLCTVCVCTHAIQVWGIVSFVLVRVFPQPSNKLTEINSTLSVFYNNQPYWGCGTEILVYLIAICVLTKTKQLNLYYYEEQIFSFSCAFCAICNL